MSGQRGGGETSSARWWSFRSAPTRPGDAKQQQSPHGFSHRNRAAGQHDGSTPGCKKRCASSSTQPARRWPTSRQRPLPSRKPRGGALCPDRIQRTPQLLHSHVRRRPRSRRTCSSSGIRRWEIPAGRLTSRQARRLQAATAMARANHRARQLRRGEQRYVGCAHGSRPEGEKPAGASRRILAVIEASSLARPHLASLRRSRRRSKRRAEGQRLRGEKRHQQGVRRPRVSRQAVEAGLLQGSAIPRARLDSKRTGPAAPRR